jgi:hypothetical protein
MSEPIWFRSWPLRQTGLADASRRPARGRSGSRPAVPAASADRPLRPYCGHQVALPRTGASGQCTKSLRDSPLTRGPAARTVTKGEIVDSGLDGLS